MLHFALISNLIMFSSAVSVPELDPDHGDAPKIDGIINSTVNEWKNATKTSISLSKNESITDKGIPINLWVMLNESDQSLYISIQFELEKHDPNEFIGILISEMKKDDEPRVFLDAKFAQFSLLGEENETLKFFDYYIEDDLYYTDNATNGTAGAKLEGNKIIYEIQIPLSLEGVKQDVFLDYGEQYFLKILYGVNDSRSYNETDIKSGTVLININYPPQPPPDDEWPNTLNIISAVIFISMGGIFIIYIYRIAILKKKIERFGA